MKALKLNLDLSKNFVEKMKDKSEYVELRECYNNTFKAVGVLMEMNVSERKEYKIAYGFVDKKIGSERMYFRHAFLVNVKYNCAVDVTALLWKDAEEERVDYNYYIFKEYDDINCYTDDLLKESGQPGLYESTMAEEVIVVNELNKMGLSINPVDLIELMHRLYGNDLMEGFRRYKESNIITL